MTQSIPLTFLGTGNFAAPGRGWNSFLIDGRILVESSPIVLLNLRKAGVDPAAIDVIFLSHFHADHTFGWPFLLLNYLSQDHRSTDLWVVGPLGVGQFLDTMVQAGAIHHLVEQQWRATGGFGLHHVEVNGQEQSAGDVRFRAVRVEHDPTLDCYGYLIRHAGRTIGYSGDTRLCDGLRRIAKDSDVLVLECNQRHGEPAVHMSLEGVRALRNEFPHLPFVLTHRGQDVDAGGIPNVCVPEDLETVTV
jgi:ribonuclease Z